MPLTGTESITTKIASGSVINSSENPTLAIALLAGATPARTVNPISSGTGATVSGTNIVGGVITRTGPTSAFTDTTDTAAAIIAALPVNTPLSTTWFFFSRNTTPYAQTIAAGGGVSLAGDVVVPANSLWVAQIQYTSLNVVTITGLASVPDSGAGYLAASAAIQFGGDSATFLASGLINRQISSAGISPGATGADNVLAAFTLSGGSLDGIGNRGLLISTHGSFAANGNNKRLKIIWNPTTAVVGSTVGSGGTTVADSGTVTTNGGGWHLAGRVFKYGSAGSNTQITSAGPLSPGTPVAPVLATAVESGAILIAVTGNATTTASDIVFNMLAIEALN